MIIVSRIIHVKVDRRLNVNNKFKYQRRLSSRLAIVMFRGTPCIFIILSTPSKYWVKLYKNLPEVVVFLSLLLCLDLDHIQSVGLCLKSTILQTMRTKSYHRDRNIE